MSSGLLMTNTVRIVALVLCGLLLVGYWSYSRTESPPNKTNNLLKLSDLQTSPALCALCEKAPFTTGEPAKKAETTPARIGDFDLRDNYLTIMKLSITGVLAGKSAGACTTSDNCGCDQRRPYSYATREIGGDWPPYGTTMVGIKRLENIQMAIEDVAKNNVPGDFVELGVWRGGACIFARACLKSFGLSDRKVYVFDAMELLLPQRAYGAASEFLAVSEADIRENFEMYHLWDESIVIKKGFFRDTVSAFNEPKTQFAVLRIDGNFYDSYQDVMYAFYERVPVGGYVIFDDIGNHESVALFWKHFKEDHNLPEVPIPIDVRSAYFKKIKDVKIDKSKKHPDMDVNKG
jgi:hypothetical protein